MDYSHQILGGEANGFVNNILGQKWKNCNDTSTSSSDARAPVQIRLSRVRVAASTNLQFAAHHVEDGVRRKSIGLCVVGGGSDAVLLSLPFWGGVELRGGTFVCTISLTHPKP